VFHLALDSGIILAQEADSTSSGNPLGFLLPILIIGAVFYVLLILPQRRRSKKAKEMHSSIGIGDEVRTVGGIFGTVRDEDDDVFLLDVGSGTTIRIAKRAIAERIDSEAENE